MKTPGPASTNLPPDAEYYIEQQALYEGDPAQHQRQNPHLGELFAIEAIERDGTAAHLAVLAQTSSAEPKAGRAQNSATGRR